MAKNTPLIRHDATQIERKIYLIRGVRVMLDEDIAAMYDVATKVLNQAVQRNLERFPEDFSFTLTEREFDDFKQLTPEMVSQFGGRRYAPRVFTEQGVAMLSGVLRSPMAVKVNVEIMRAFIRMRRLMATPGELVAQIQELAAAVLFHEDQIEQINDVLNKMLSPDIPHKPMGFHTIPSKKGKGS
jgi:hypothetical protein